MMKTLLVLQLAAALVACYCAWRAHAAAVELGRTLERRRLALEKLRDELRAITQPNAGSSNGTRSSAIAPAPGKHHV